MPALRAARRGTAYLGAVLVALFLAGCVEADGTQGESALSTGAGAAAEIRRGSGDEHLVAEIGSTFAEEYQRAAVAIVEGDEVRTAYVDADESTAWEIGSITKVLTGELLAIAIERGEVALDDTLGEYLDLGGSPSAAVTLRGLATHTSGLPVLPDDPVWRAEYEERYFAREDPWGGDLATLLALARTTGVAPEAGFEYSNLGAALLGQALASAAGTEYSRLLQERVLEPLGMEHAVLVETDAQVPETHAGGTTAAGQSVAPISWGAFAPAGGVDATLGDLVALAKAVLDGRLQHSAALEPITEIEPGTSIGYFWWIDEVPARTITWHPGRTSGFGSALLIDRDAGVATIVLSNADLPAETIARRLLVDAEQ
ncbi:serine hydrolase domain-containing protein [Agromyces sp. NPDC058136]|uniref:serine hydrolase domain-containing protein n=1 Tax=Agromyces sp. NPDC058136 TaxID=3346354 RepID=UPI0036D8A97B